MPDCKTFVRCMKMPGTYEAIWLFCCFGYKALAPMGLGRNTRIANADAM